MTAPRPNVRRVRALFSTTGLGIVSDGKLYETPEAFVRAIRAADRRRGGFAVTVIEWENCPEGFTPPTE